MSIQSMVANRISGQQKAAIVLMSLGPAASAEILKKMPEEEVNDHQLGDRVDGLA